MLPPDRCARLVQLRSVRRRQAAAGPAYARSETGWSRFRAASRRECLRVRAGGHLPIHCTSGATPCGSLRALVLLVAAEGRAAVAPVAAGLAVAAAGATGVVLAGGEGRG